MLWILLPLFLVTLIWYLRKPMTYWKDQGVKQTKPWPIFGDSGATLFQKISRKDFVQKIYDMYPNTRYTGFYQLSTPTLLIKDPELIKQITIKDFDNFTDHGPTPAEKSDGIVKEVLFILKGKLSHEGQRWREMRATLSGSFTSSKMKQIFHLMQAAAEDFATFFLDRNEEIIEVEMKDVFSRFANDVIATSAFGIQCNSLTEPSNKFYLTGKKITTPGGLKSIIAGIGLLLFPKLLKLLRVTPFSKEAVSFFKNIIQDTIKTREEKGIVRPDMINLLLEARRGIKVQENETIETGFATVKESSYFGKVKKIKDLSDDLIAAQAFIFFFAGFETVSTALCFGSYELAINMDIQEKLRQEIKETYKNNDGKITYEVLLKMKYLDMVISEILRKWTPAIATDRLCIKPYTIEPVNSNERPVHLKPGDIIYVPINALHSDPAHYPNPENFDPERFSDENKNSIKNCTYLPFGSGPRNCIGSRFALLEVKAMLFNLLLHFEIVPNEKTQIPVQISKKGRTLASEKGFCLSLKRIKN